MEIINNNNRLYQPLIDEKLTPIQSFLSGSNIFITGGTGFLGKSKLTIFLILCDYDIESIVDFIH